MKSREELFDLAATEGRIHLGDLSDGSPVFSKLGSDQLANHQDVIPLLPEVFGQKSLEDFSGPNMVAEVNLGRVVGLTTCVETSEEDQIRYARKKGRKFGCSRFVMNREGIPCGSVVLILYQNNEGLTAFMTAYIGQLAPADPCTRSAWGQEEQCIAFWKTHALIWDGDVEDGEHSQEDFFTVPPREED